MQKDTEKVRSYLNTAHRTQVTDLVVKEVRNAGGINKGAQPYEATYSSADLKYRSASVKFWGEEMSELSDTYSQEITCLKADEAIEAEGGSIPFVIYSKVMHAPAASPELNLRNHSLSDLQKAIFKGAEFQTRVLVNAPDIKKNRRKYELFHIELMRRMKNQHMEKSTLEIFFLDGTLKLEDHRSSPRSVLTHSPIKQHTLERWSSIHNIKWYNMVKDHPEKVLQYGDVYPR